MTCEFMKHSIFLKSIDSLNHVREEAGGKKKKGRKEGRKKGRKKESKFHNGDFRL